MVLFGLRPFGRGVADVDVCDVCVFEEEAEKLTATAGERIFVVDLHNVIKYKRGRKEVEITN